MSSLPQREWIHLWRKFQVTKIYYCFLSPVYLTFHCLYLCWGILHINWNFLSRSIWETAARASHTVGKRTCTQMLRKNERGSWQNVLGHIKDTIEALPLSSQIVTYYIFQCWKWRPSDPAHSSYCKSRSQRSLWDENSRVGPNVSHYLPKDEVCEKAYAWRAPGRKISPFCGKLQWFDRWRARRRAQAPTVH